MTKKYSCLNKLLQYYNLVLASGSPRRVRLLTEAGIAFRQIIPDIEEANHQDLPPYQLARQLAEAKAAAVRTSMVSGEVALGSDTIVVLEGEVLGKPESPEEAIMILSRLSGRKHTVCTAVALNTADGDMISGFELSDVYFKKTDHRSIEQYVATGEPLDKAGAYGIQEQGFFLVDRVNGNIDNVIGLPLELLDDLAGKLADKKGL